jgi:hypothetical protein
VEIKEYRNGIVAAGLLSSCLITLLALMIQVSSGNPTISEIAADARERGINLPLNSGSVLTMFDWVRENQLGTNLPIRIIYSDPYRTFSDSIDIEDPESGTAEAQIREFAVYTTGVYDVFWQMPCADGTGDYDVRAGIWNGERYDPSSGFYVGRAVRQEDDATDENPNYIYIEDQLGYVSDDRESSQIPPGGFLVSTGNGDGTVISESQFNRQLAICLGVPEP